MSKQNLKPGEVLIVDFYDWARKNYRQSKYSLQTDASVELSNEKTDDVHRGEWVAVSYKDNYDRESTVLISYSESGVSGMSDKSKELPVGSATVDEIKKIVRGYIRPSKSVSQKFVEKKNPMDVELKYSNSDSGIDETVDYDIPRKTLGTLQIVRQKLEDDGWFVEVPNPEELRITEDTRNSDDVFSGNWYFVEIRNDKYTQGVLAGVKYNGTTGTYDRSKELSLEVEPSLILKWIERFS